MLARLPELPKISPFDAVRLFDPDGEEFWSARDLMTLFGYPDWQSFNRVLLKAQKACERSGHILKDHFMMGSKHVVLKNGAKRWLIDVHLTRYACYLVAQNGHPSKPMVAKAQSYIAIQTMRSQVAR